MRDPAVPRQRLDHVGFAERNARLTQILRIGAQHHDLARRHAGGNDHAVEAVVLDFAAPDAFERFLERLADCGDIDGETRHHAEVVNPDADAVGQADFIRQLVDDPQAHVLQHRQDIGQRQRTVAVEYLEAQIAVGRAVPPIQFHRDVAGFQHGVDPADIDDRLGRREKLPVLHRKRLPEPVEQRQPGAFALGLRQRVREVVGPVARRFDHVAFDVRDGFRV